MPPLTDSAAAQRQTAWQRLGRECFDVLVIGGGITGAGVARDAALRGLRVALVDKGDFAGGTSSKSSKLIHGGLRYLQQYEFGLVFEAVRERTQLLRLAPHLVRPQRFLFPAYRGQYPGLLTLGCGLWVYEALSWFSSPARHRSYRQRQLLELEPGLRAEGLRGGMVYFDSVTDDARLTLENLLDARDHGAVILSYARVTGLLRSGVVRGAVVEDALGSGVSTVVRARLTVNATGPWSDQLLALGGRRGQPLLRPTKGVHVVVAAERLPLRHAVVMIAPQDGRVVFAIPWSPLPEGPAARTILGTTDTDFSGDPDQVAAEAADVDYLLGCANHYFPQARLGPGDVLATWAGLRPLVAPLQQGLGASQVSREHRIVDRPGLITVVGGKLTTYRRMAAEVVEAALGQLGRSPHELPCRTGQVPLPGARGLGAAGVAGVAADLEALALPGLDAQVAWHLAYTYGGRAMALARRLMAGERALTERLDAELPYLLGEVDLAVEEEAAVRLEDVLARRLPLLLQARDQGLGCAARVADRMATLLGWSAQRKQQELAHYEQVVALSRRFRHCGSEPSEPR
ncbi:MAG: glycerol-3-phosphate dehydrogenase/oxidase [Myxococcales bacterium]|nr:glycerol-3-phosphate dehydrogenase/oxidase [Myxococcota bacterium]MDW8280799.1 glycerol-3-phosphate dehydrogenase/oxidase [Myxococcales bacterium]